MTESHSTSLWRGDLAGECMSNAKSESDSVDAKADDMPEEIASNSTSVLPANEGAREGISGRPLATNEDEKSNVGRIKERAGSTK